MLARKPVPRLAPRRTGRPIPESARAPTPVPQADSLTLTCGVRPTSADRVRRLEVDTRADRFDDRADRRDDVREERLDRRDDIREERFEEHREERFDNRDAHSGGRDDLRWRYRWHNGQWWYWTPQSTWLIWSGSTWTPHVVASVPSYNYSQPAATYYYGQPSYGGSNYYNDGYYGRRYNRGNFYYGQPYRSGYRGGNGYGYNMNSPYGQARAYGNIYGSRDAAQGAYFGSSVGGAIGGRSGANIGGAIGAAIGND